MTPIESTRCFDRICRHPPRSLISEPAVSKRRTERARSDDTYAAPFLNATKQSPQLVTDVPYIRDAHHSAVCEAFFPKHPPGDN